MNKVFLFGIFALTFLAILIFLASCVVTLSDGQGALVFVFSIPLMAALLFGALFLQQKMQKQTSLAVSVGWLTKFFASFLVVFFVTAFVPGLKIFPEAVMGLTGKVFLQATGKTPYVFFKERASFPNKLAEALKSKKRINFSDLGVTFAWDKVCIFGPYTTNAKAKSILKMDWDIEERSQILYSDSVNALVFLYQGSVNHVVDLKRGIADFKELDFCMPRSTASFNAAIDENGRRLLELEKVLPMSPEWTPKK